MKAPEPLLYVRDLRAEFGDFALQDIALEVWSKEHVGIVGESGSGKSLLAKLLMGLVQGNACGDIRLQGIEQNLATIPINSPLWRTIRAQKIAYIPQSPKLSLNPLHTIYKQLAEMCALHLPSIPKAKYQTLIDQALESVGLEPSIKHRLPHTLSGGQAQRVCIAMMSLARPRLLICDEPTTALDAHIQSQILALLDSFMEMAIVFITHDLGLIERFAGRLYVMQGGKICDHLVRDSALFGGDLALLKKRHISLEFLEPKRLDSSSLHPYTRKLLNAIILPKKPDSSAGEVCLSLQDFAVYHTTKGFFTRQKTPAIQGVNLRLRVGDSIGIIGASGSGKSSLALGILGLEGHLGGLSIYPQNTTPKDLIYVDKKRDRAFVSMVQIVFQDPLLALNPRMCVLEILQEALQARASHKVKKIKAPTLKALELLEQVGLASSFLYRYSHTLSGGEAQRVCIARALASGAKILLLDEPTSALDKNTQKDIITLLLELQSAFGLSYVVISHDLNVIEAMCAEVIVLDFGQVVEQGGVEQVFSSPTHPCTRALLRARI